MRALIVILLLGSVAHARPEVVDGVVVQATSYRDGDVFITTSLIETTGGLTTVRQLGGTVDGIGMTFSHHPRVLRSGDRVSLVADGNVVTHVHSVTAPAAPVGKYGIQRNSRGLAVFRDSGCLDIFYDSGSIDASTARILDAAFASWETAVETCGELRVNTSRLANAPSAIDGISTVHVRSDRWCRSSEVCYAPEAAAVTRLIFVDNPSDPLDGRIIEADMDINATTFAMIAPGAIATPGDDRIPLYLQAVVTHEAGHVLGLAHACGTGDEDWPTDHDNAAVPACDAPDVQTATMFVSVNALDDGPSTLEANDIAGACAIFREVACVYEVNGGCSATKTSTGIWFGLVLVGLRRRRKA
jgi:uncharacterized protein (TIGR03382 family)